MKRLKFRKREYILDRDPHCFIIYKPSWDKKNDQEKLVALSYFNSLENAFNWLFNQHVLDNCERKSLIQCVKETKKELMDVLGGIQ